MTYSGTPGLRDRGCIRRPMGPRTSRALQTTPFGLLKHKSCEEEEAYRSTYGYCRGPEDQRTRGPEVHKL